MTSIIIPICLKNIFTFRIFIIIFVSNIIIYNNETQNKKTSDTNCMLYFGSRDFFYVPQDWHGKDGI